MKALDDGPCIRGLATLQCVWCQRRLPLSYPTFVLTAAARAELAGAEPCPVRPLGRCPVHGVTLSRLFGCALCNPPPGAPEPSCERCGAPLAYMKDPGDSPVTRVCVHCDRPFDDL